MTKIAINGFGRIGRFVFNSILNNCPDLEVVAINDLAEAKLLAHLLKYDSVYGSYGKSIDYTEDSLIVDGQKVKYLSQKDPADLPWGELEVDIVLECTGRFICLKDSQKHIKAGAKKVIISAPCKGKGVPYFVMGVNEEKYDNEKDDVISMASCTTNALAPIAKVLHKNLEIESGLMTTIHSYTSTQKLLDGPHKDLRRARAAALSLIPTTTGAAIAVIKTIPELKGKINGMAIRTPTPTVSLVDFVAKVKKDTTIEQVNDIFRKAAQEKQLKGILGTEDAPLVSMDYRCTTFSGVIDTASTMVENKNLVKILAWYDNEWGYAYRLAEFAKFISQKM